MPHGALRCLTAVVRGVALVGLLFMALPAADAHAEARGGLGSVLDVIYLAAVGPPLPLLPLVAGAGLFLRTGSHLVAAGVSALVFGAWGAFHFAGVSLDGPWSGALFGLANDGVTSGLVALGGSGYVRLVDAEGRRLGRERTAIAHGVGIGFAVVAFALVYATHGSDKVELALYVLMLLLTLGVSAATGSFGGVVVTMVFALFSMVLGLWASALASGARDAGQAFIAIFMLPKLLVPVVALAAVGRWLGGKFGIRRGDTPG